MRPLLFVFLVLCMVSSPLHAQSGAEPRASASSGKIYTWVDEKGVRHYSDEAPTQANAAPRVRSIQINNSPQLPLDPQPTLATDQSDQSNHAVTPVQTQKKARPSQTLQAITPTNQEQQDPALNPDLINPRLELPDECSAARDKMGSLSKRSEKQSDNRARALALISAQSDVTKFCGSGVGTR